MSVSPVMSITDELVAELEALAGEATMGNWCTDGLTWVCAKDSDQLNGGYVLARCEGPDDFANAEYMAKASPLVIRAMLAERAELRRVIADVKWRVADTTDQLQATGFDGDRRYGIDEWSGPIKNLNMAIGILEKALESKP